MVKKMKISNKNKIFASLAIFLLAFSAITLLVNPIVQAQTTYENLEEGGSYPTIPAGVTPDLTLSTAAYLSFRPNPVGFNQIFLVNVWLTPATHVSRYFSDYTITIETPSGEQTVITMDSYRADATAWFEYIANEVGTWRLKFDFPGGYFPAGNYTTFKGAVYSQTTDSVSSFSKSVYYEPSTTGWQELEVQEDIVYSWPEDGLPTDYWTRPVTPEKREWAPILGWYPYTGRGGDANWPADTNIYANSAYDFTPYVQAPATSHVVWKKQESLAGLVGGDIGAESILGSANTPSIIYNGRCYDTYSKVLENGTQVTMWESYDLRTGEQYWEQIAPSTTVSFFGFIMSSSVTPSAVHLEEGRSAVPGAAEVSSSLNLNLVGINGGVLRKWDPYDGSLDTEVEAMDGTIYSDPYVLSVQTLSPGNYRLINWSMNGASNDFTSRVVSNITWPLNSLGTVQDFESMVSVQINSVSSQDTGAEWVGITLTAVDMITGEVLWTKEVNERYYSSSVAVADHGKVAVLMKDGDFLCFDLFTGDQLWRSEQMDYPWDAPSFGAYSIQSAYGMFYRAAYSGVYAFNWDNGTIAWKYEAPADAVYETPYVSPEGVTVYSFNAGGVVADGKFYICNTEHTETEPITRGWGLHCIDAYTGDGIWNITGKMSPGAMADGYITAASSYDGYMYVFGKGESETSVTASPKSTTKGNAVLIEGTVLDISPAQEGTPCVSGASMTTQMEYLHLQRPINGIWGNDVITGVPVTLTALDSTGDYIDLGTVTSDGYYGTFCLAWTPDEGTYQIIASFAGDDSYGSSSATTYVTVGPAASASVPIEPEEPTPEQPTPEEPTPEQPTPETPTPEQPTTEEPEPTVTEQPLISAELAIVIAVIAACIIGAVAYVAFRKRK